MSLAGDTTDERGRDGGMGKPFTFFSYLCNMYLSENPVSAEELFDRLSTLTKPTDTEQPHANSVLHEVLAAACHEGTKETHTGFGNLFSQVDFLCKRHHVAPEDMAAIQKMRRDSNRSALLSREELLSNVRAAAVFVSAVFGVHIPSLLVGRLPAVYHWEKTHRKTDIRCIRCIVQTWDAETICAIADRDGQQTAIRIDTSDETFAYLHDLLHEGMQLNLLDCECVKGDIVVPALIVVEPDYLVDISTIARCFTEYGHHPLVYWVNRMMPSANTQAILLGHFAGSALDDMVNDATDYDWQQTFRNSFKEKALEYTACEDLNEREDFRQAATRQAANIRQIVDELFNQYDRRKAILEPSFVCERLGIQGRVDLMTTDFRLLVEQKSGRNYAIERQRPNAFGSFQKEDHYVQLLLYSGMLRQNFHLSGRQSDIRLLYSRYPLPSGLVVVSYYRKLFHEAIRFRNALVANEYAIARNGFESILDSLTPETLNERRRADTLFTRYQYPQIAAVTEPLRHLSSLERAYFCRMMTFVTREQLLSKVGTQEGMGNSTADLWTMPLSVKKETGNIYMGLTVIERTCSTSYSGYDTIALAVPEQGEDFLPNFRTGDMVYLYAYPKDSEPDVRQAILFRGVLESIATERLVVHLNDGLQNPHLLDEVSKGGKVFAIEHSGSDATANSAVRGLHEFVTSPTERKALLLGQRPPQCDATAKLSRSYHPHYDDALHRAKQAKDYFLLVGPPGTGKTSMALQYLVKEELATGGTDASILLTAYTNRAVDEICGMLADTHLPFIRLGNAYTCDQRFLPYLLRQAVDDCPQRSAVRERLLSTPIIVGTTSTLQSRPFLFDLKRFSLAIVDEAGQIPESGLIGLLASHRGADALPDIARFILVGDHKQLPAVVQQNPADTVVNDVQLHRIGLEDCRESLFERLLRLERRAGRNAFVGILHRQGRMHPDIADFPVRSFYAEEALIPVPCAHQTEPELGYRLPAQDALDKLLKTQRMLFLPSSPSDSPNISDKVNPQEAAIVCDLLRRLHRFYGDAFDPTRTVGIIVPYRNQIAMIRRGIERLGIESLNEITIDTVERYQGSQRDVIIYSFTVTHRYQLDFLTGNCFVENGRIVDRKLNVALTRARKQLILTGCLSVLSANTLFRQLIQHIRQRGGFVTSMSAVDICSANSHRL